METIELYKFRVRDPLSGKWRETRYRLSDTEALVRYGDGNYERLDWTREVRSGAATGQSTSHLMSSPSNTPD
jgi:hypothetical protein